MGWVAVAGLNTGCAAGESGDTGDGDRARDLASATTVPDAPATAWPTAGRDLANSRAVPGSRLTSETIADIAELCRTPLPDARRTS